MNSSALIGGKFILRKKNPLQDLFSSLNAVISTNESTRFVTSHVIFNLAYTYKFQLITTIVWLLVGVPGIVVTFYYVFTKTTSAAKIDVKSEINVTQLKCHEVKKDWQEYISLSQYAIQGKDFWKGCFFLVDFFAVFNNWSILQR